MAGPPTSSHHREADNNVIPRHQPCARGKRRTSRSSLIPFHESYDVERLVVRKASGGGSIAKPNRTRTFTVHNRAKRLFLPNPTSPQLFTPPPPLSPLVMTAAGDKRGGRAFAGLFPFPPFPPPAINIILERSSAA